MRQLKVKDKTTKQKQSTYVTTNNKEYTRQYYYKIQSINIPLKLHHTNEKWEEIHHI